MNTVAVTNHRVSILDSEGVQKERGTVILYSDTEEGDMLGVVNDLDLKLHWYPSHLVRWGYTE